MPKPLILYSTNTWLSYIIAERYYRGEHYAWCTPYFDARALSAYNVTTPPTSTPSEIYRTLLEEVRRGDRHSMKIQENKIGILQGATYKRESGIITEQQEKDIATIVDIAETRDFKPLLYIIPYDYVTNIVKDVPVEDRAHPLSVEYIIECLPRNCFDVTKLFFKKEKFDQKK